jgi:ABC-type branched-subunit amino acid transport system ATPase component
MSLRCENLGKSFGGTLALAGVSVEFPRGDITAVIGPNGAGKTTLLNLLTGFLRADSGCVFLGDHNITRLPPHRIARLGICRTFQDIRLITLVPVLENVMLARPHQQGESLFYALTRIGVAKEEPVNKAKCLEILDFIGLADKANDPAGELSYGQQKLLSLGMCLATEAPILFLDEPVAGVAPQMVDKIVGLMLELKKLGKTIIFIEHDIETVRRCADRTIVMDEGWIIADCPTTEVLEKPEIMEAYLG